MKFISKIKNNNNINKHLLIIKKQNIRSKLTAGLLTFFAANTMAMDTTVTLHKGDQTKTTGFAIAVADRVTPSSNFYWSVGYSSLNDVKVKWNNDDLFFRNNTLELMMSYRQKIQTYNAFLKKITFEYQLGASVGLTDNKFIWTALNEEKSFSESGDVNPVVSFATHYSFNKKTSALLGVKHQPSYSDFGDVSSVFFGINYKFGTVRNY